MQSFFCVFHMELHLITKATILYFSSVFIRRSMWATYTHSAEPLKKSFAMCLMYIRAALNGNSWRYTDEEEKWSGCWKKECERRERLLNIYIKVVTHTKKTENSFIHKKSLKMQQVVTKKTSDRSGGVWGGRMRERREKYKNLIT